MDISKKKVPQNGWFIVEKAIKMDDLGVPLFLETPTFADSNLLKLSMALLEAAIILNMPECKDSCNNPLIITWNLKHPFISGCFNWMMNQFIGNVCFTMSIHFQLAVSGTRYCMFIPFSNPIKYKHDLAVFLPPS